MRTNLIYLQGISTSLPREVQDEFLRTIEGLENVEIVRYGYAVEYDYFEPTQIFKTFETRPLRNLFFAGQINGTSGYEEAAGQGFLAGVNAAHNIKNQHEFILGRDEAYLGVLVDDLVTKGTLEPYRMFTSRAEHRLVLREDNTIDRLADRSESIGLLDVEIQDRMLEIRSRRDQLKTTLERERLTPTAETQRVLMDLGSSVLLKPISYAELMRRPEISSLDVERFGLEIDRDPQVREAVEIDLKYSGYVQMQREMIERGKLLESERIPENVDYKSIGGLSSEEVEKLNRVRPMNLGQAQRISGVNPSAIQAIVIHIKKLQKDGGMRNEH